MNRGVYTLALRTLAPLIWLWMGHRARRAGGEWGIFSGERFGHAASDATPFQASPVWVHAVSLGETRAAQPLVQGLLDLGMPVLLTHTTATGRAEGQRLFADAVARGQLRQAWLPYDFPGATARFLRTYAPRCGVLIEREIWPNLLAAARKQHVPVALVSARFSSSSLRQASRMGSVMREALAGLNLILAQSEPDAERLVQAGAREPVVTGNLKFDLSLPPDQIQAGHTWRTQVGRPIIAVASTREGEDALFIDAIRRNTGQPGAPLYLLIPRHPQRFDDAAALLEQAGVSYVRRSAVNGAPGSNVSVLLGDSLGEMAFYYAASDVAIVAGSFAALGGQNMIEACAAGVPVIVGPHTFNFKQAAEDAVRAGAALRVDDAAQAIDQARALVADTPRRQAMGEAARAWSASHTGATARTLQALEPWLTR